MAVAEGFEPSDGGYPSHAFEACSLGRSDTPPRGSLPVVGPQAIIAASCDRGTALALNHAEIRSPHEDGDRTRRVRGHRGRRPRVAARPHPSDMHRGRRHRGRAFASDELVQANRPTIA